ncbi:hypothetical protein ACOSP7_025712 [Xanthoceras sorbifolium]|uniref:Uncharacterized protein n=1 Tax=Xanthoceras sorbifolium TaxID=99658 RepID=A0ABQ8H6D6_9ROSI|nr:hypothetical protein JRO89_XS13G0038200 [Xanthoceras sorbifolium]
METTKPKVINQDCVAGRVDMNIDEWEIRPGGLLVQKRYPNSNQISASIPTIKVRVKYDSIYHEICITSQASFGELKKMVAERTGLHPQDQKLIYRKKERDSKEYLDAARVKNGSKIVLVEDIANRERRCLEMLKIAKIEKASKSLAEISLEVDKFAEQVTDLQVAASKGEKVLDIDLENLNGKLMTQLVKLDEISVEGDLKLQKRGQERRAQKHIEILDTLKLCDSKLTSNGGNIPLHKQEHLIGKMPISFEKKQGQSKQRNLTGQRPNLQHQLRHSESAVFETKWETFD